MRSHPCLQPLLAAIRTGHRLSFSCPVAWSDMAAVRDGVRHCARCEHQVYDLRGKTNDEIEAAIVASDGALCGQVYARSDGLVVSGDCDHKQARVMRGRIVSQR